MTAYTNITYYAAPLTPETAFFVAPHYYFI